MGLLKDLWRESWPVLILSILGSSATALLMIQLIALISGSIAGGAHALPSPLIYAALATATLACQASSSIASAWLTQRAVRRMRTDVVHAFDSVKLRAFESMGHARVLTTMVDDTARISDAMPSVVTTVRDTVFILACIAYLAWLSTVVTGITAAVVVVGALIHGRLQRWGTERMVALRNTSQALVALLRNLLDGLKQTKLSQMHRQHLRAAIGRKDADVARLTRASIAAFTLANAFAVMLFLVMLGAVIYSGSSLGIAGEKLVAYTLTLIFMLGPLQSVSSSAQALARARVARQRVSSLEAELVSGSDTSPASGTDMSPAPKLRSIHLKAVSHTYRGSVRETFTLGPLDLQLTAGDVLFVVGGNGSGKTTLAKILSGLYLADHGTLSYDGVKLTQDTTAVYRSRVTTVFSDFTLFDGLGGESEDIDCNDERVSQLIEMLGLDDVIDPSIGLYAQASSFSSGEKKRVALLLACLDSKDMYIFDEVASDLDPSFKDAFYHQIVQSLSREGKIVVVISHDSRYFSAGNAVLHLERGRPPVLGRPYVTAETVDTVAAFAVAADLPND